MSNDTQPEIRFPGFTDDWEQRKFKEFSKKTGKKNTKDLDFPAYSVSNKAGLISQTEQFDGSRLDDLEKTNYKFVEPNEFAYNPARVNVGSIAFNNLGMTVIVSSLYVVVKMSEDLDNEFILQFIKSPTFIKEVKRNTEGSVREYLFYENFANIKFPFTRNKEEQQKIGSFFKQLDNTIALHQRKLDLLKETKKGFLQKMFPKNGAKVPEIRFPGFTEDWEQRKLGDIFKKDIQKNKDLEFNSDSVISVAKMKLSTPSAKSSDEYMKTYNKIWKGNIAFEGHTNDEFPNGRFVLNDCQDGIVSHIYDVYSAVDEYDNEFMKRYINNPYVMRKILINATSSARMMKSLNSVEFLKQSILLPILSEQQKIGGFFYQLDNIIALHQRKLDLLKETKKGFLQKMFV